jgi:hypothetical protein
VGEDWNSVCGVRSNSGKGEKLFRLVWNASYFGQSVAESFYRDRAVVQSQRSDYLADIGETGASQS